MLPLKTSGLACVCVDPIEQHCRWQYQQQEAHLKTPRLLQFLPK